MADKKYIEVNAVKRELVQLVIAYGYEDIDEDIEEILDRLPAADVAPVVHAEWKERNIFGAKYKQCSNCGISVPQNHAGDYCSHCGAEMDGGEQRD